jgi:hypothetical protein
MKKITVVVPDNFMPDQMPHVYGNVLNVQLWYPRWEESTTTEEEIS